MVVSSVIECTINFHLQITRRQQHNNRSFYFRNVNIYFRVSVSFLAIEMAYNRRLWKRQAEAVVTATTENVTVATTPQTHIFGHKHHSTFAPQGKKTQPKRHMMLNATTKFIVFYRILFCHC